MLGVVIDAPIIAGLPHGAYFAVASLVAVSMIAELSMLKVRDMAIQLRVAAKSPEGTGRDFPMLLFNRFEDFHGAEDALARDISVVAFDLEDR